MKTIFANTNHTVMFISGDFNTDLLNPNKLKTTEEFIIKIFNLSLCPLITKPSKITHCATLIENIFTNFLESS